MAREPTDISGRWNGVYSYPVLGADETFIADLLASHDQFTGLITEVARLPRAAALALTAEVVGTVDGATVLFAKTYDGTGGWTHTVSYHGQLNGDGTEISGNWWLPGLRGTFLMVRLPEQEAVIEAHKAAPADTDR